jgi:hypothetical protein
MNFIIFIKNLQEEKVILKGKVSGHKARPALNRRFLEKLI